MAQPPTLKDMGILLAGSPGSLTITNHSKRTIVAYQLLFENPSAAVWIHSFLQRRQGDPDQTSIPLGESRPVAPNTNIPSGPRQTVTLEGVIFDNGEFVGPDRAKQYEMFASTINGERALFEKVSNPNNATSDNIQKAAEEVKRTIPIEHHIAHRMIDERANDMTRLLEHNIDISSKAKEWHDRTPQIWRQK